MGARLILGAICFTHKLQDPPVLLKNPFADAVDHGIDILMVRQRPPLLPVSINGHAACDGFQRSRCWANISPSVIWSVMVLPRETREAVAPPFPLREPYHRCSRHWAGLITSNPAARNPSTKCSAPTPERTRSACRESRPAAAMVWRVTAAISSSDSSSGGGSNSMATVSPTAVPFAS